MGVCSIRLGAQAPKRYSNYNTVAALHPALVVEGCYSVVVRCDMEFLIGLLVGLFAYGSIMYILYWGNIICCINTEEEIITRILIGLGWVCFIPHIIYAFIRYKIIKPIIKRIKK